MENALRRKTSVSIALKDYRDESLGNKSLIGQRQNEREADARARTFAEFMRSVIEADHIHFLFTLCIKRIVHI